jgi:quercetin dioxygenase-like cupin family protein
MERFHLPSVQASGRRTPKVLLSTAECRAVVIDLAPGDRLGEHSVHERALVQVVSGRVRIESNGDVAECDTGTLAAFAPGERHAVEALGPARVLLLLAPWPGAGHYADGDAARDPADVAPNARVKPDD